MWRWLVGVALAVVIVLIIIFLVGFAADMSHH